LTTFGAAFLALAATKQATSQRHRLESDFDARA
jgi:hypothetical protein